MVMKLVKVVKLEVPISKTSQNALADTNRHRIKSILPLNVADHRILQAYRC